MMMSVQTAASPSPAIRTAKVAADMRANGTAAEASGTDAATGTTATGTAIRKDFATVASDARAALDAVYRQRGKAMDMRTSGTEWEAAFQGMDRRALYAVASNAGGRFSKDEQGAADFLMGKQVEKAQGIDSADPASIAAFQGNLANAMKAGAKFLDTVSDEEKQSVTWAMSRASMQHSHELIAERDGKPAEALDSDHPLVRVIKAALGAAKGDPAREHTEGRVDSLASLKNQPWAKGFEAQIELAHRPPAKQGSLLDSTV
ncbi:hypothetical protein [Azospirillum humicireducens]|uniref:hypothetical protein n=1 Tax=Azospirillum humicireducens TaxID=1226968 RepID=UPI00157FA149|nr:hypothetical protein [Azospirillum humicireducens]